MTFWRELKQRHVYRVAIGYAVSAWAAVQVANTVLTAFRASPWILQTIIVLVALGFPVALYLGWTYEITARGITRAGIGNRRNLIMLAASGLGIALIGIAGYWLITRENLQPSRAENSANNIPPKSIAVLPFASLSEEKENAYFAEGIQDEVLTRLAKVADLKVISRTSTARYKSSPNDLRQIARQLGAANILEGSVQRAHDSVRVNVQLINALTDTHVWAEIYDRKLTDIFAVESDIAKTIADALHARLNGSEEQALAARPTTNPEAYDAYLRGIAADARFLYSFEKLEQAAQFFARATQLDPNFAQAWARLARVDAFIYFRRQDTTPSRRAAAEQALARAKALAPNTAETVIAEAYYHYWVLRDYEGARRLFHEAEAKAPGNSDVHYALSSIARRQGRWEESLAESQRAADLNPRDPVLLTERAWTQKIIRHFDDALATYDHALEILPGDPDLLASKASIYQAQGNLDAARQQLEPLRGGMSEGAVANAVVAQQFLERKFAEAIASLRNLLSRELSQSSRAAYLTWLAFAQRWSGDQDGARKTAEDARRELEAQKANEPGNEDVAASLSQVYVLLGDNDAALAEARRATTLLPATTDAVLGPGYEENLASVRAQLGDRGAIAELQRLLNVPEINGTSLVDAPLTLSRLRLEPTWDRLRSDPEFQRLTAAKL